MPFSGHVTSRYFSVNFTISYGFSFLDDLNFFLLQFLLKLLPLSIQEIKDGI